ncbi:MAG: TolC family protein [Deltaproteobacteria bacterium]|nr:TolC family protein [Deltaproteobacteria bacterium]
MSRWRGGAPGVLAAWAALGVSGCLFVDPVDLTPPDPAAWIPPPQAPSERSSTVPAPPSTASEAATAGATPEVPGVASPQVSGAEAPVAPPSPVNARAPSFANGVPPADATIRDVAMPLATGLPDARPLALAEILATVGAEALDIRSAQQDAASAEAERRIVRDSLLPSFSAQAKFGLLNGYTQGTAGRFFNTNYQNTLIGPKVELTYDLAAAVFTLQAAQEHLEGELAAIRVTANDSLHAAATGYFDLVESCAQLWIAEISVRHGHELVDLELTRVSSGAGLEVDLLRAQAKLAEAERGVLEARRLVAVASAELVEQLGLPPSTELVPAEDAIVAVELIPLGDLDELVRKAVANRPEVAQAGRELAASQESEGYWENRWIIPQVKLSAEYGGFGTNPRDLQDREIYTAAAEWSLDPMNLSQLDKARATRRKAEVAETQVTRMVASEVVQAFRSSQAAAATISSAVREVQASAEAYELVQVRYREGVALQEEVLRAELDLTRAQSALTGALASYDRSQFDLARAIGGPRNGGPAVP